MNGKKIAYRLIGIGVTISIALLFLYLSKTTELDSRAPIDADIFSSYGSLVGGVLGALFSLAGVFLLINTLEAQECAIRIQQTNFSKQLFESKFFDLVNIHRQNSFEINLKDRIGRKVFLTLQREFYHCKLVIDALNETWPEKLLEEERINISYMCFFFGAVGETSEQIMKRNLTGKYPNRINFILERFKKSQKEFTENDNFPYKLFEGHQSRLGHYFRHLYQTVKFVDEQPSSLLTYKEKYSYVKILRAQLSTQEQAFLFYNSLSDLGKAWEKQEDLESKKLITKYNLIKNIPTGYTSEFDVVKYYPNVRYEGDPLTEKRIKLEENYR